MKRATPPDRGTGRLHRWALGAGLMVLLVGSVAHAAPSWLKRAFSPHGVGENARAKSVARYRIERGGAFVLDETAPWPLLKFEDSPEVWVLSAARGPRGDMIYRSDLGRPILRTTRFGGVTVFTPDRPDGSAAASIGIGAPLRLVSVGPAGLYRILLQSSARATRAARHLVGFEAPDADPTSDGLIADAAMVASEAVVALSSESQGRALLTRLARVEILRGERPSASLRGGVVDITVTPALGVAGRPSSQRILFAIGAR